MEGEAEPTELGRLKRDLAALADDFASTGEWLGKAWMLRGRAPRRCSRSRGSRTCSASAIASSSTGLSTLVSRLVRRALQLLEHVDFAPDEVRADLAGGRVFPGYLYSTAELLDRAADLTAESAMLVHDNERRWRVFHARVEALVEPENARKRR